jgi:2-keto-4-pentenoate hydratase/2-oxohepta-3-ene-1,7-dioic acid hydratase in catechol pathway
VRIVSFEGGFGELLDGEVRLLGRDLTEFLVDPRTADEARAADRRRPLSELTLRAPVPRPNKIICVGLNYRDHARETGKPIPTTPMLFAKFATSVVGDGAEVTIPAIVDDCDYEAELGVVIGAPARDVDEADALAHVAGYLCANDLSARTLQRSSGQFLRGKAIDGFLPTGPWLTTADEVPDPQDLAISCRVNGEVVQDSSTSEMIFGVAELIAEISKTLTLEPGDLLVTGTPPGIGAAMDPPRFLGDGDEVAVTIEGLGTLTTTLRAAAVVA